MKTTVSPEPGAGVKRNMKKNCSIQKQLIAMLVYAMQGIADASPKHTQRKLCAIKISPQHFFRGFL